MRKIGSTILISVFCLASLAFSEYRFYDGEDWTRVGTKRYPQDVKLVIKETMLKAIQDASFLSGDPILSQKKQNVKAYINPIDQFYGKKGNSTIPLHFALKITNMEKRGLPEKQIQLYRLAILKKLNQLENLYAE